MRILTVLILALIVTVWAAPTSISDNNIGDIVNVYVSANLNVSNRVDQDIVNVILGYLNQQAVVVAPGQKPAEAS